ENEAVERSLLALRHEGATQPEEGGEQDRDPEEAARLEAGRRPRQREMEDDEDGRDEEEHCRQRVARPELEEEVLARERADIAGVAHTASARPSLASGATCAGSWVARRNARSPRSSASCASSSSAPASSRAL